MTPEQLAAAKQILELIEKSGILDKLQQSQGISKDLIYLGFFLIAMISFFLGKLMTFHKEMKNYREMTLQILKEVPKLLGDLHDTIKVQLKLIEDSTRRE